MDKDAWVVILILCGIWAVGYTIYGISAYVDPVEVAKKEAEWKCSQMEKPIFDYPFGSQRLPPIYGGRCREVIYEKTYHEADQFNNSILPRILKIAIGWPVAVLTFFSLLGAIRDRF